MKRKITRGVAVVAALGALALGGSAIAGAVTPNHAAAPAENASGPDTDNIQSGDQSGPDNEASGAENSSEGASETGSEAGNEVAGDDGPGGHADEPGNAGADHQAEGAE